MSLRNGTERIFDVIDLEAGEPHFLAFVALSVRVVNGYLLPSRIVVGRSRIDGFGISLDGDHLRSARASGRCPTRIGRAAYSAQCARVPCVRAADRQLAQGSWNVFSSDEVVKIRKGLKVLVDTTGARIATR